MDVIGLISCRLARESRHNGMGMESWREYFERISSSAGFHMRMRMGIGSGIGMEGVTAFPARSLGEAACRVERSEWGLDIGHTLFEYVNY